MTDYDYNDHRVQLTGEESKNGASSLDGYSLYVSPQANWPGLSADPNKQILHTDDMSDIAAVIDGFVSDLQGSSAMTIQGDTAAVVYGPDRWEAAAYLKQAQSDTAKVVQKYVTGLITNLTNASSAIKGATTQYTTAEATNTQNAKNQQSKIDY